MTTNAKETADRSSSAGGGANVSGRSLASFIMDALATELDFAPGQQKTAYRRDADQAVVLSGTGFVAMTGSIAPSV